MRSLGDVAGVPYSQCCREPTARTDTMRNWVESAALLLVTSWLSATVATSPESAASDVALYRQLAALLSPAHATANCARKLIFGGNCECNFRDPASGRSEDISFDMHMYGQRRVCIGDGYLWPGGACRVLSVQVDRYSGDPKAIRSALANFGCADSGLLQLFSENFEAMRSFSLRARMKQMGTKRLDLLDVSVPGMEEDILRDLLRPKGRIHVKQLSLTVVLDADEVMGEPESSFTAPVARRYVELIRQIEAAGYGMLTFKPHPKCIESVQKMYNICLPILADTTWIK